MALFDVFKQVITGRPINITGPTFIRDKCDAQTQMEKMEELKKTASPEILKQLEQDIKILSYGISGENMVAFELKNSHMPILILRDLYLEYQGLTAQIDYVVIDTHFILVIECKKMTGDIEITNTGDFIRLFKNFAGKIYKREGIYSPLAQNERHLELIKKILSNNMEKLNERKCKDLLHSIVVLANPKTIINMKYAKANIKKSIIRCDQLIAYMKNLHDQNKDGYWLAESGMYKVAEALMAHHKENAVDFTQKYAQTPKMSQAEDINNRKLQLAEAPSIMIEETPIYKELQRYRLIKSREEGIKPYYVYNNTQLEQIIALMPETHEELKQIKGIKDVKCSKYGDDIIKIVRNFK